MQEVSKNGERSLFAEESKPGQLQKMEFHSMEMFFPCKISLVLGLYPTDLPQAEILDWSRDLRTVSIAHPPSSIIAVMLGYTSFSLFCTITCVHGLLLQ